MQLEYKEFTNNTEAKEFISEAFRQTGEEVPLWFQKDDIRIYGYFYDATDPTYRGRQFFVFGRTILRNSLENKGIGIFAQLKQYGSSRKYKGLMNIFGKEILPNEYDSFSSFIPIECDGYTLLIAEKYNKKGLVAVCNSYYEGKVLTPIKFDDFFYANEYTLGFKLNQKIGFMNMNGKIVIEAKFISKDGFNFFNDSKALVKIDSKDGVPAYINHYGDVIEYYVEEVGDTPTFGNGTGYYPFGELPSALDAYEGDSSNYWNND